MAERQLLESFSRMLPELLRFSSASHLLEHIPDEMQAHHRANEAPTAPALAALPRRSVDLWDGWGDAGAGIGGAALDDDAESLDLSGVL